MDTITIIVIIVLIIFIIAGVYFYQDTTDKIETLEEENSKAKEEKTMFLDETGDLKKRIAQISNGFDQLNKRLIQAEDEVDDVKKETFTLSMHSRHADPGPHPAVAAYGRHALPPREQQQSPMGQKPPGMSDKIFEKFGEAAKNGMKQNNFEIHEEMFDPNKQITPKNVEYDRMDPAASAAERRAEGFGNPVGGNENAWRAMGEMVKHASQGAPQSQGFEPEPSFDEFDYGSSEIDVTAEFM